MSLSLTLPTVGTHNQTISCSGVMCLGILEAVSQLLQILEPVDMSACNLCAIMQKDTSCSAHSMTDLLLNVCGLCLAKRECVLGCFARHRFELCIAERKSQQGNGEAVDKQQRCYL